MFEYEAASELFEELPATGIPPQYEIRANKDGTFTAVKTDTLKKIKLASEMPRGGLIRN